MSRDLKLTLFFIGICIFAISVFIILMAAFPADHSVTSAESNNAPITVIYKSGELEGSLDEVYIIYDDERQVTCWVFTSYYGVAGVYCSPDDEIVNPPR
jgi:hypothetical protein